MEIYTLVFNLGYDGKDIEGSSFSSLDRLVEYVKEKYPDYSIPDTIWKESEFYPSTKSTPTIIKCLEIETTTLVE